tara:strand:- start:888 stop:1082 length:195 start_codon:yes stop_codon:yes gene_type:complete
LDIKDHLSGCRKNCDFFEEDVNWAEIRQEVGRIQSNGWSTLVSVGDADRILQVAERMGRALGIE